MKAKDVQIGKTYVVKVSGGECPVRIVERFANHWHGINLKTNRSVTIKSAQRLRREYVAPTPEQVAARNAKALRDDPKAGQGITLIVKSDEKSTQAEADALGAKLDPQERAKVEESCRKVFKAFLAEVGNSCWEDLPEHVEESLGETGYAYAAAYIDALEARVLKALE